MRDVYSNDVGTAAVLAALDAVPDLDPDYEDAAAEARAEAGRSWRSRQTVPVRRHSFEELTTGPQRAAIAGRFDVSEPYGWTHVDLAGTVGVSQRGRGAVFIAVDGSVTERDR